MLDTIIRKGLLINQLYIKLTKAARDGTTDSYADRMPDDHAQLSTSAPQGTPASRLSAVDRSQSTTQDTLKAEVQTSTSHISVYSGFRGYVTGTS